MGKVKDTATFIEAAKLVHGDKYDYSKTIYKSSRDSITIVCKVCGPVVLANADSHYRPDKRCGCRTCEKEATLQKVGRATKCDCCGKRVKYNPQKRCSECATMLNDKWCVALSKSLSKIKKKSNVKNEAIWFRWARSKQRILNQRHKTITVFRLQCSVGSWDAWELKSLKKLVNRKKEDRWTKRLRGWGWALSQREKKQGARIFVI